VNIVLLHASEAAAGPLVTLDDERARHLRSVVRVTVGQPVRIGVVDGALGTGVVRAIDDRSVTLECTYSDRPPLPPVDLLLALPRPKVLRRLWAQIAALGARRIIVTNAARVERNYFDTHLLDESVYRPLLLEGLQQARDTHVPVVTVQRQFRKLVEDDLHALTDADLRVVADPASDRSLLTTVAADTARVLLAVGPEGGWNGFELSLLSAHRFASVGLGTRTLRSDTACIALMALTHEALRARSGS
jgi:RsmE family RNA methyltransferase